MCTFDTICQGLEYCVLDNRTVVETNKIAWINSGNVNYSIEYLVYYHNKRSFIHL